MRLYMGLGMDLLARLAMGFYMGLGMDLLASTFDVESVVFLKRGSHFLACFGMGLLAYVGFYVGIYVESVVFLKRGSHFVVSYGAGGRVC